MGVPVDPLVLKGWLFAFLALHEMKELASLLKSSLGRIGRHMRISLTGMCSVIFNDRGRVSA